MLTDIQIQENKNKVIQLLSSVDRKGMKELIEWLSDPNPSICDFFIAPASTMYHGNYKGGLCEHSLHVYDCLLKVRENYYDLMKLNGQTPVNITDEQCIIVALLHDLCKVWFYKEKECSYKDPDTGVWMKYQGYGVNDRLPLGHGDKSIILIQRFMALTGPEMLAIRWHMGQTPEVMLDPNYKYAYSKAMDECPLCFLLHQADSMAAFLLDGMMKIPGKN